MTGTRRPSFEGANNPSHSPTAKERRTRLLISNSGRNLDDTMRAALGYPPRRPRSTGKDTSPPLPDPVRWADPDSVSWVDDDEDEETTR